MNQLDMFNESSCTNRIFIGFSIAIPLIIQSEISPCLQRNKHLFCIVEKKAWSIFRQPIQSLYREKNITIMSGSNCHTNNGIVIGVLSERSTDCGVCHGPCSGTLVCRCYARFYLLINQLFYLEFL